MKPLYSLLLCLFIAGPLHAWQSAPDFKQIKDYHRRMDSLKRYCNQLMGSNPDKGDNFPQALVYGLKGLAMARPDDHQSRGQFALISGIAYYNTIRFDSALVYMRLAGNEGLKAGDIGTIAWSRSNMIALYLQTQQPAAADSIAEDLKAIADTTTDRLALGKCYYGLGNYYYLKSYYATAQSYFLKSLDITRQLTDTSDDNRYRMEYAVQNYMLYKIYSNNELFDRALAALKDGSRYMSSSSALRLRYQSAYVDAYTTLPVANIDSALYYYHKLAETVRGGKNMGSEYVMSNIAIAQYYVRKGELEQASVYVDKGMELAASSKAPFLIHQAQNMKGLYQFRKGNYDEAIALLDEASAISKNVNKGNYLESIHTIAQAYKAKGNLKKAIEYYDLYDKEKEEYTRANLNRYFADMNVQYSTREKEKQISALSNANKVRELELKNATRFRMFLIAGLVALGIISLLLYRIYRHKEKMNKTLNDRNHELDRLNARLALANESKAKLFGIFSHDLRSPVSKIAQFLRLQKENPDLFNDNARSEYHEKFTNVTANLLNTMEDLLLWSKSQMENFTPEYHATAIREVADKELQLLSSQIEEKHLVIDNKIPPSFHSVTDENFLSIIFRNLLQNAVRYSSDQATISLETRDSTVRISNPTLSETGAAALNALLQQGTVSSASYGLGLQIAKDLAERIGIHFYFTEEHKGMVTAVLEWTRQEA